MTQNRSTNFRVQLPPMAAAIMAFIGVGLIVVSKGQATIEHLQCMTTVGGVLIGAAISQWFTW